MEHYFIWICNGNTCSEENSFVVSYVSSLLATPENISLFHSSVPILKCTSSYLAVINTQSEKSVEWIKTNPQISSHFHPSESVSSPIPTEDEKDICEEAKESDNNPCKEGENARDLNQLLSNHLHKLADELPVSGSFKLDVIIHQNVLNGLSVSKDHQFVMSLYRLYRWHSAVTTFVTSRNQDQSCLKEWCNFVDAEIIDSTYLAPLGPVVWRGSLKLNNRDVTYPGFQLRVDMLESEIKLSDDSSSSEDLAKDLEMNFILSPRLEVVWECDFYSIPSYLILPVAFRLNTCQSNMFNKKSKELLECIYLSNTSTAIIVRLHFAICYEKLKPDKSLNTNKWHKTFSTGKIKNPDNFPTMEKFLTLAITKSPKTGEVVAHPLRGPGELNARGFLPHSKLLQSKDVHSQNEDSIKSEPLQINLPSLSPDSFESLINEYNSLKETCCKKHSSNGSCCKTAFLENITKTFSGSMLKLDSKKIKVIKEDLDPNDWPERVCLYQKQLEAENEKINAFPNVFRNLSPPHLKNNTFTFSCKDVDKYFLPSGESKNKESVEGNESIANETESIKTPMPDIYTLMTVKWPEVLAFKYEDMYYNCSQASEDKEATGNKMVQIYVQHETSVTCNNAQLKPNAPIVIRSKSQTSEPQKYRSPATPRGISRLKQKLKDLNRSSSSQSIGTPILKRSLSNSSLSENKKELKREVSRNIFPVRASPRKKNVVNYSLTTSRGVPRHHSMKESVRSSVSSQPPSKLRRTVSSTAVPNRSNGALRSKRNLPSQRKGPPSTGSPIKKNSADASQSASRNSEKPKRNSDPQQLPDILRKKLRVAVATALEQHGINLSDDLFRPCGKKLFAICQTFVQDIPQKGSVSQLMQKVADSHVKQVIEFEKLKL